MVEAKVLTAYLELSTDVKVLLHLHLSEEKTTHTFLLCFFLNQLTYLLFYSLKL